MRDIANRTRIRIEGMRVNAPFILVGASQAGSISHLLQQAHVGFEQHSHINAPDVMFSLDPGADMATLQRMLDQAD